MHRRTVLATLGTVALAGCSSDNGDGGNRGEENGTDNGNVGSNDDSGSGPKEIFTALFSALNDGNRQKANSLIHPNSPMGEVGTTLVRLSVDSGASVQNVIVENNSGDTATVGATLNVESERSISSEIRINLRKHNDEWKIYDGLISAFQGIFPGADIEGADESTDESFDVPDWVDMYLNDNSANGYPSSTDMKGEDSITIEVGAGSDGLAFDPVAVRVNPGTGITWEWVDVSAGAHNVAVNQAPKFFESETVSEEGHTFTQTLEEIGNYLYECTPHAGLGMHGAVIVED